MLYTGSTMVACLLVHSPLVGPLSWEPVAEELRRRGHAVAVPAVCADEHERAPLWQQHAQAAAQGADGLPADQPLVLAGHSGAGPLLPAVRVALNRPVAAYLFVDAGLPEDGKSRLDLLRDELPEMAVEFAQMLAAGGSYPTWTDADLTPLIPDPRLRAGTLAELRPRAERFWTEPLAVSSGWPDAPCAYLQLSPGYDIPAAQARAIGWPFARIDAAHFHLLVDPPAVTGALLGLLAQLGIETS
jgi:hypothetical protein